MKKIDYIKGKGWEHTSGDLWYHPYISPDPIPLEKVGKIEKEGALFREQLKQEEFQSTLQWLLDSGWRLASSKKRKPVPLLTHRDKDILTFVKDNMYCGIESARRIQLKADKRNDR